MFEWKQIYVKLVSSFQWMRMNYLLGNPQKMVCRSLFLSVYEDRMTKVSNRFHSYFISKLGVISRWCVSNIIFKDFEVDEFYLKNSLTLWLKVFTQVLSRIPNIIQFQDFLKKWIIYCYIICFRIFKVKRLFETGICTRWFYNRLFNIQGSAWRGIEPTSASASWSGSMPLRGSGIARPTTSIC